jgi:hypothetical protein
MKINKKRDAKPQIKKKKLYIQNQKQSLQLGHPHPQFCKGRDQRKEKKKRSASKKRKLFP